MIAALSILTVTLWGCSDASYQREWKSLGQKHKIQLWSGGTLVREWTSTGRVRSVGAEDGWCFVDKETDKLVIVTGDLVIEMIGD